MIQLIDRTRKKTNENFSVECYSLSVVVRISITVNIAIESVIEFKVCSARRSDPIIVSFQTNRTNKYKTIEKLEK